MTPRPSEPGFDLIWTRPPRRSRGQGPPLTRERIVQAAIELADERGLEGLSTRAIATRLGTGPTSMYWHVPNMADLYELVIDALIGEIALPDPRSADWRATMRALVTDSLRVLQRHPWSPLLGIQPGIGPNNRRYAEFAISVLAGVGLDHDTAIEALAVLNNYLFGFATRWAAWQQLKHRAGLGQDFDERIDQYLAQTTDTDPLLAAHIQTRIALTSDQNFELGLDCVLEGIARRMVDVA